MYCATTIAGSGLLAAVLVTAGLSPTVAEATGIGARPPTAEDRRLPQPPKQATAVGRGGAVSSVDPYASRIGLRVLKQGGNAVDAAVATAAALGVTEPYSAGIGGGGFFVFYDAKKRKAFTIDGRETAPRAITRDAFIDPATGDPYAPFFPNLVTSGISVGVPGTPATWRRALVRWGSWSLARTLRPAAKLARKGFVVDQTFQQQTLDNRERFATFTSSKRLFLRGGPPKVGTRFRNPDLAQTYHLLAREGVQALYTGNLAREIVRAVRRPPLSGRTDLPVPPGKMKLADLRDYEALDRRPSRTTYRGLRVLGMAPPSSGGSTVGEALNILERFDLTGMDEQALHLYLEAGALAFADRAKYLGDPDFVRVPLRDLLSDTYAAERACHIDPAQAAAKPVPPGDVKQYDGQCDVARPTSRTTAPDTEGKSTTNLTVVDRRGNIVEYTLTIEQTGGSGIVVPGRGFLLNNELTDFSPEFVKGDPNRIQPGKRPRSSMSPTIVLRDGRPILALGSPGGSTIITTVLQILLNRYDFGMGIEDALAAPRVSPRNASTPVLAEHAFLDQHEAELEAMGHQLAPAGDPGTTAAEIGAATAIEIGPDGFLTAVAEPSRRGGGDARVVRPD